MRRMSRSRRQHSTNVIIIRLFADLIVLIFALVVWTFLNVIGTRDPNPRTQTDATALLQAIEGFHNTYDTLPSVVPKGGEMLTEGKDAVALFTVLYGREEVTSAMENKKQIRFMSIGDIKRRKSSSYAIDDEVLPGPTPQALYDSAGRPFHVRFASGDEPWEIPDPFKPGEVVRDKVAIVYSYGKNGKPGDRDDVKTW